MLNKYSRVMFGTKMFMDLLNEIASINGLKEFFVIVNHDDYNYRIKGLYSVNDLKKINYPKRFRKTVYNAEPISSVVMTCNDENSIYYGQDYSFDFRRDWNGCLCYHVEINDGVSLCQDNDALKLLNIKQMEEGKYSKFVLKYKFNDCVDATIYDLC